MTEGGGMKKGRRRLTKSPKRRGGSKMTKTKHQKKLEGA